MPDHNLPVRILSRFLSLTICLIALIEPCCAQHEPAQLLSLSRSAGQVGSTFDLRVVTGDQLIEIGSLRFSHPSITAELKTLDPLPFSQERRPDFNNFNVTIPADLTAGRYEVWAEGRTGISNPRAFLVSNLTTEALTTVSHDAVTPTPITAGTIYQAKSTAAEIDYFQVNLQPNQPLRIELLAQQLDSRMIGQVKLLDQSGHELTSSRGADEFDPALQTPSDLTAGNYLVAVHDFLFRGGDDFHYQLVARPIDQAPSLISPQHGGQGILLDPISTRSCSLSDDERLNFSSELADDVATSAVQDSHELRTIDLPFVTTESFPLRQADAMFQFAASEGDTYSIDVMSQRTGQPTDARWVVQRIEPQPTGEPKLHEVLTIDDCQSVSDGAVNLFSTDAVALFKAPATADYRLSLRDLDIGRSLAKGQRYTLRIAPPQPGFHLVAYRVFPHTDINQTQPFGSRLFRGGSEMLRVFVVRRDGWNGAVRIRCEGLPAGVTASESIIAANQTMTQITVSAAEDAAAAIFPIRIVGQSEDGSIQRQATPATVLWGKGAGRDFIRTRLTTELWLAVSDKDLAPLTASLGSPDIVEIKKGESAKLPIKLVRREGGKDACVIRPRDLPAGVTAPEVNIAAEASEGECDFKVEMAAVPGTYSLWMQLETKIRIRPNPQALERAQTYRTHLQTLHDDPAQAANLETIKAAIVEADKLVEAAKGPANEKELTVFIPTSIATIRVVEP
jgi:hypothetical protein